MNTTALSTSILVILAVNGCTHDGHLGLSNEPAETGAKLEYVQNEDIEWGPLNPARGDKSPRAGKLWGDRTSLGASGFLVQFVEGFSSPPHIHNVTYRGVVLEGLVHNDDPDASDMWLPAGSYWTQPAGQIHITAAKSQKNTAYIEIGNGPYLVMPTDEAFPEPEQPINVDVSNVMWLDASDIEWINHPSAGNGPQVAFLWGNSESEDPSGYLLKLPPNYSGTLSSTKSAMRAVVIEGSVSRLSSPDSGTLIFDMGSYFGSESPSVHLLETGSAGCTLYIRVNGRFNIDVLE